MEYKHYFKVEGTMIFNYENHKAIDTLTWGPFYYHDKEKAKAKINKIMTYMVDWVNGHEKNVETIKPQNEIWTRDKSQIVFHLKAWKDDNTCEDTRCLISVTPIYFEDEN
jgi:hypothetical protein